MVKKSFPCIFFVEEQKSALAFSLLPLLFPTGTKSEKGRKGPGKHATTAEALNSFIQVKKVSC